MLAELLVVLLIIGILALIALPILEKQRQKGQDTDAKSNATNLVRFVERCYVDARDYTACETADLSGTGLPLGTGEGQVGVAATSVDSFVVTAVSRSTGKFFIRRQSAGTELLRDCDQTTAGCRSTPDALGNRW
jgi:Tfp pilus assembly protein PilE